MPSLKQLAIRGTLWTMAGYGLSQITRFGSNLILTRLLFPELFGLMALINIFIVGLELFSDVGVGPSIIQNPRGEERDFLNTAWTIQVIRGWALWLGAVMLAWPVAAFYGDPQFRLLIPVVGLTTIVTGFESTNRFTLQRRLAVRELAIFELGGQIVGASTIIIWSLLTPRDDRTIWILIFGQLFAAVVQMFWSHRLIPNSWNRIHWDPKIAKEILSFGRWIFISTACTFLATQADRLILGKLLPLDVLGVYGIAFMLSVLPKQVLESVSDKVIFPAVSQLAELPRATFRAKIEKNRIPVLIVLIVSLAIMTSFSDLVIEILYDERYQAAAWMLPILTLGIWPVMLTQTTDPALFAIGQPRYTAYGTFFSFLVLLIATPLAYFQFGIPGAVIAVALREIPYYIAIMYGLQREKLYFLGQDLLATALYLGLVAILILGRSLVGLGLPIDGMSFPS